MALKKTLDLKIRSAKSQLDADDQKLLDQLVASGNIDLVQMSVDDIVGTVSKVKSTYGNASPEEQGPAPGGSVIDSIVNSAFGWQSDQVQDMYGGRSRGLVREASYATALASKENDPRYTSFENRFLDATSDAAMALAWHFTDAATMGIIGGFGGVANKGLDWVNKISGGEDGNWLDSVGDWMAEQGEAWNNNDWRNTHTTAGEIAKWTGQIAGMFTPSAPLKAASLGVKSVGLGLAANKATKAAKLAAKMRSGKEVADGAAKLKKLNDKAQQIKGATQPVVRLLDKAADVVENPAGKWARSSKTGTTLQVAANFFSADAQFNAARVGIGKLGGKAAKRLLGINAASESRAVAKVLSPKIIRAASELGIDLAPRADDISKNMSHALNEALESVAQTRSGVKRLDVGTEVMDTVRDSGVNFFTARLLSDLLPEVGGDVNLALKILERVQESVGKNVGDLIIGKSGAGVAELISRSMKGKRGALALELSQRTLSHAAQMSSAFAINGTYERMWRALSEPQLYLASGQSASDYALRGFIDPETGEGSKREGVLGDLLSGVIFGAGANTIRMLPVIVGKKAMVNEGSIARNLSKWLGGGHGDWEEIVGQSSAAIDKVLTGARRSGVAAFLQRNGAAVDIDLLTDRELAAVASNYNAWLSRAGHRSVQGATGIGPGQKRHINTGYVRDLLSDGVDAQRKADARAHLSKVLKGEQDEVLGKWKKMSRDEAFRDMRRSIITAIPLFFANGGLAAAKEVYENRDIDSLGVFTSQLAMAFAAATGSLPHMDAKDGVGAKRKDSRGIPIPDAELPGMTQEFVEKNRIREQLRHLGTYDADLVLVDHSVLTPSEAVGEASMHAAQLIDEASREISGDDKTNGVPMDDTVVILEPGQMPANDGRRYVHLDELRAVARWLRGLAANGVNLPEVLRSSSDDPINSASYWSSVIDDMDAGSMHQLARFVVALRGKLDGQTFRGETYTKDMPISGKIIDKIEQEHRLNLFHTVGSTVDDVLGAMVDEQRKILDDTAESSGSATGAERMGAKPVVRRINIAGVFGSAERSGLSQEDYDAVMDFMAMQERFLGIAEAVGSAAVDGSPERGHTMRFENPSGVTKNAANETNRRNMLAIKKLTAQMRQLEEALNSRIKSPHKFTLHDDSTARMLLEMAADGGRDLARMFVVDQAQLWYDEGQTRARWSLGDLISHLQSTGAVRVDPRGTTFINDNIDYSGLSYAEAKGLQNLMSMLAATKGFRVVRDQNSERISGKKILGAKVTMPDGTVLNKGLLDHLEMLGLQFTDDAATARYIEGIATANMAAMTPEGIEIYANLVASKLIRTDKSGRRLLYIPQVAVNQLAEVAAREAIGQAGEALARNIATLRAAGLDQDASISTDVLAHIKGMLDPNLASILLSGDKYTMAEIIAAAQKLPELISNTDQLPTLTPAITQDQANILYAYAKQMIDSGLIDGIASTDPANARFGKVDDMIVITDAEAVGDADIGKILSKALVRNTADAMKEVENGIRMLNDIITGKDNPVVAKENAMRLLSTMRRYLAMGNAYGYRQLMELLSAGGVDMFILDTGTGTYKVNQRFEIANMDDTLKFVNEYFDLTHSLTVADALAAKQEYGEAAAAAVARGYDELIGKHERDKAKTVGEVMRDIGIAQTEVHAAAREGIRKDVEARRLQNNGQLTRSDIRQIGESLVKDLHDAVDLNRDNANTETVKHRHKKIDELGEHDILSIVNAVMQSRRSVTIAFTGGETIAGPEYDGSPTPKPQDPKNPEDVKSQHAAFHATEAMEDYNIEHHLMDMLGDKDSAHNVSSMSFRAGRSGQDPNSYVLEGTTLQRVVDMLFNGEGTTSYVGVHESGRVYKRDEVKRFSARKVAVIAGDLDRIILHDIPNLGNARVFSDRLGQIVGSFGDGLERTSFGREILESARDFRRALEMLVGGKMSQKEYDAWVVSNRASIEQVFDFLTSYSMFGTAGTLRNIQTGDTDISDGVKSIFSRVHQIAGQGPRRFDGDLLKIASEIASERDAKKASKIDEYGPLYGRETEAYGMVDGKMRVVVVDDSDGEDTTWADGQVWINPHAAHSIATAAGFDTSKREYGAIKALLNVPGGADGAFMAKSLLSVNPLLTEFMRSNNVAMVITKSAAKTMFGDYEGKVAVISDSNGNPLSLRAAIGNAELGVARVNDDAVFEMGGEHVRFQTMVHAKTDEATITWQMENGWREEAVSALTDAYMLGGNVAAGVELIRKMYGTGIEGRMSSRSIMIRKNKWDNDNGLDDGATNLQKAYLMASEFASPHDLGMGNQFLDTLKSAMLKDNVFKGRSRHGGSAPLGADVHGVLSSREAVLGWQYGNRTISSLGDSALSKLHFGFKARPRGFAETDASKKASADAMAEEYGFEGANMYNDGPGGKHDDKKMQARETSWRSFSLVRKTKRGKNGGFIFHAIRHLAEAGSMISSGRSTAFARDIEKMKSEDSDRIAAKLNDLGVDLLNGEATLTDAIAEIGSEIGALSKEARKNVIDFLEAMSAGDGMTVNDLYAGFNNLFGAMNGRAVEGYQYGQRRGRFGGENGNQFEGELSERGRTSLTFGMVMMAQRSPSNRVNDTLPLHLLGFGDRLSGNHMYMGYDDAIPIAEADFDKDTFNFWWDSPKEVLSDAFRLANSSMPLEQSKDKKVSSRIKSGRFIRRRSETLTGTAAYEYSRQARRSNALRGQLVKASRLAMHLVNIGAGIEFSHGKDTYRIVPKGSREEFLSSKELHRSMLDVQQMVQSVLDSKKTGLPDEMMDEGFSPLEAVLGKFYKVEIKRRTSDNQQDGRVERSQWDLADDVVEPLKAIASLSRVYGKVLGLANDGFEGADKASKQWSEIADDAFSYNYIMSGEINEIEARLASHLSYTMQFMSDRDQPSGVLRALHSGLESGGTRVLLNSHDRGNRSLHRSAIDNMVRTVMRMEKARAEESVNAWMGDDMMVYVSRKGDQYTLKGMARKGDKAAEGVLRLRQFKGDLSQLEQKLIRLARQSKSDPATYEEEYQIAKAQFDVALQKQAEDELLPVRNISEHEKVDELGNYRSAMAMGAVKVASGMYRAEDDGYRRRAVDAFLAWRNNLMRTRLEQMRNGTGGPMDRVSQSVYDSAIETAFRGLVERFGDDAFNMIVELMSPEIGNSPFMHRGQMMNSYKRPPVDILRAALSVLGNQHPAITEFFRHTARASLVAGEIMKGDPIGLLAIKQLAEIQDRDIPVGALSMSRYGGIGSRMRQESMADILRSVDDSNANREAMQTIEEVFNAAVQMRQTGEFYDTDYGADVKGPPRSPGTSRADKYIFDKWGLIDRSNQIWASHQAPLRSDGAPRSVLERLKQMLDETNARESLLLGAKEDVFEVPGERSAARFYENIWRQNPDVKPYDQPSPAKSAEIAAKAHRRAVNILKTTVNALRRMSDPLATDIVDRGAPIHLKSMAEYIKEVSARNEAQEECGGGIL